MEEDIYIQRHLVSIIYLLYYIIVYGIILTLTLILHYITGTKIRIRHEDNSGEFMDYCLFSIYYLFFYNILYFNELILLQ